MADFNLKFQIPAQTTEAAAARTLYWPVSGRGSFNTSLGPRLGALGPVPVENADLFRLAAMVYAADRSVLRQVGRVNWTRRTFALAVPVEDPDRWNTIADELSALFGFLSGDEWNLSFRRARIPRETVTPNRHAHAARVVLMSGGADSATGAFLARQHPEEHILVSHVGATGIAPIQRDVAERIRTLLPDGSVQHHRQITFTRHQEQPGGYRFRNENSTRTRSLLFLALGLAIASINRVPLWIPENGFASLNPPLGPDQLGSLSTRTTHPWFLSELSRLAGLAGAWAEIANPFAAQTKGEMFRWLADEIGDNDAAADFLRLTNSCGYTGRRWIGATTDEHCGTCFGCLVRRASFNAAGVPDRSHYLIDSPTNPEVKAQLERASILPSIIGFVARGINVKDIAAMRLPSDYPASNARALCVRGLQELGTLL